MRRLAPVLTIAFPIALATTVAHADLVISTDPTQNLNCSGGVCTATAKKAVLNAGELGAMLVSGDTTVKTGAGAINILVKAAFGWTTPNQLTLIANHLVEIERPVTVGGTGAVKIRHGRVLGEDLRFLRDGRIDFSIRAGRRGINGDSDKLVSDVATLADQVAANPSGNFALANDYNAGKDGAYSSAPVVTEFDGKFEGLGHVIRNLAINVSTDTTPYIGLFSRLHPDGELRDIGLENIRITVPSGGYLTGALVGETGDEQSGGGSIVNAFSTGTIAVIDGSYAGGLVGFNEALTSIVNSHSDCTVNADTGSAGGLAGYNQGVISGSYATGEVRGGTAGGLVGFAYGYDGSRITNSYATGAVYGSNLAGGLVGNDHNAAVATKSYSTGGIGGGQVGGFAGTVDGTGAFNRDYWDESTSGTNVGCGGGACYGVIGLTNRQLRSGLPHGLDPQIWGQNSDFNNGYPYLLANPPPK